jgi:hypothetical protein
MSFPQSPSFKHINIYLINKLNYSIRPSHILSYKTIKYPGNFDKTSK